MTALAQLLKASTTAFACLEECVQIGNRKDLILKLLLTVGIFVPPVLVLGLVARYAVNVPFADDFTLAPMLLAARNGTLSARELFAQHNEHRMVLSRLVTLGFAQLARGDLRLQMMFSVVVVALTGIVVWLLIRSTITGGPRQQLGLMLLFSILLFSPVQAENWTWAFQCALFLNNLLLVTAIAIAVSKQPLAVKFVVATVLSTVATYSFGSGLLLWLLTFPLALLNPTRRTQRLLWLGGWIACAAAAISCYFIRYQQPAEHPPLLGSHRLTEYLLYALAFTGAHLSALYSGIVAPAVLGLTLLALTTSAVLCVYRADSEMRRRVSPWIALSAYALLNAVLAAMTRISFGVSQALSSRYTSFSIYSSIGLLGICVIVAGYRPTAAFHNARMALLVSIVVLSLGAYSSGIEFMQRTHQARLKGKAALLFAKVLDSGAVYEKALEANQHDAKAFAEQLDSLGLLRPPLITTANPAGLKTIPADRLLSGYVDELKCAGADCEARGWAFLPQTRQPPDAVVLSYGSGPAATLFAITTRTYQRVDVARSLGDSALIESGWAGEMKRGLVPPGNQPITAWAVDAESATLYQLRGSANLP